MNCYSKPFYESLKAISESDKWRAKNLLCGKQISIHDEYWDDINGEEHFSPLLIKITIEIHNRKGNYWKRGLKKAAGQFENNLN